MYIRKDRPPRCIPVLGNPEGFLGILRAAGYTATHAGGARKEQTTMPIQLAVLLSGGGTTLQNLIDRIESGQLDAEITCVISSRADAGGIERAEKHGLPVTIVNRSDYTGDLASFNRDIWNVIRRHHVDLVVLAGFMSLIEIPEEFNLRIINIHPALIPAFSGKGMYGRHVHQAVLEYGVKITGVTVHFVDDVYDRGPIILQEAVPVLPNDTVDSLFDRVQQTEREIYPRAIELLASKKVRVKGRRVFVDEPSTAGTD
jgi:phosphoribosylglycinamide formyltransferase-1